MSDQTPNLSLPFIMPAQAQKHVTHNEAIELLDMIVQLRLMSVDTATPTAAPEDGESWAVPDGATGAWAGQAGMIATWRGGGWLFVPPREGWVAFVADRAALHVRTDDGWVAKGEAPQMQNLPQIGINAVADATNRLSVRAAAVLFDHEGAGHQIKINKAGSGDTGALLFQTDYGGRAEIGLAGEDDFSIKVSPDGGAWQPAIKIAATSAQVQFACAIRLTPTAQPPTGQAGDLYFDSATAKLRCHDGTIWHDLF